MRKTSAVATYGICTSGGRVVHGEPADPSHSRPCYLIRLIQERRIAWFGTTRGSWHRSVCALRKTTAQRFKRPFCGLWGSCQLGRTADEIHFARQHPIL